jgi:hypothetical protein
MFATSPKASLETLAPSAERRAPSAERRAPSAERRAPSAEFAFFRLRMEKLCIRRGSDRPGSPSVCGGP